MGGVQGGQLHCGGNCDGSILAKLPGEGAVRRCPWLMCNLSMHGAAHMLWNVAFMV